MAIKQSAGILVRDRQEAACSLVPIVKTKNNNMADKMKVEIWSDVMCPYCYIGKRRLEKALTLFADRDKVEIAWRSYQLQPDTPEDYAKSTYEMVATRYNISLEEAKEKHQKVSQLAREYGLYYNFDMARPANTLRAHQLIHFAKENGKADQAEELLFRAYLCEGKNVNDEATLLDLSQALDLDPVAFKSILQRGTYIKEIEADIAEAKSLGLKGVPFFVFNKKVAVFGGQEPEKFVEILQNALADWEEDQKAPRMKFIDGAVCTPDGECN